MNTVPLCRFSELNNLETREFSSKDSNAPGVFLIKKNEEIYAYQNSCPHTGAPLNWQANRFLTIQKDKILCTLHGALFNIETGHCEAGPCINDHLHKIELSINEDLIFITSK